MFEGILKGIQENPRDLEKIDVFLSLLSDAYDTEAKAGGLAELARILKSTDILKALHVVQAAFRMSPQNKVVLEVLCETFQSTGNSVARDLTQKYLDNIFGKKSSGYEDMNFDVMPHSESTADEKTATRRAEGMESESTMQHKTVIADPGVKNLADLNAHSPAEKPIPFSNFAFDDDATGQMDLNQDGPSFDVAVPDEVDKKSAYKQPEPAFKKIELESAIPFSAPFEKDISDNLFVSPVPSPLADAAPAPVELQASDGPPFGIVLAPKTDSIDVTEVAQEEENEEFPDLFASERISLEENIPLMKSIPLTAVPLEPPPLTTVSLPPLPPPIPPPLPERPHEVMVTMVSRRALENIPAEVFVSTSLPKTQQGEHVTPSELTAITDTRSQPRSYKLIRNFIRETDLDFRLLEYASEFADSWFGIIHFLSYLLRTGKIDREVFARAAGVLERNVNEGDDVKAQVRFAEIIEPQLTATG